MNSSHAAPSRSGLGSTNGTALASRVGSRLIQRRQRRVANQLMLRSALNEDAVRVDLLLVLQIQVNRLDVGGELVMVDNLPTALRVNPLSVAVPLPTRRNRQRTRSKSISKLSESCCGAIELSYRKPLAPQRNSLIQLAKLLTDLGRDPPQGCDFHPQGRAGLTNPGILTTRPLCTECFGTKHISR